MIEANVITSRGQDMVCLTEYKNQETRGRNVIIYKHGFCGNKITPHRMMVNLGHRLIEKGYTIVRFDCVGSGDSEGDSSYMTIPGNVEDFKKLLQWVRDMLEPEKLMIIGYSLGAVETSLCCHEAPLKGILFWSPVSRPYDCIKHLLGERRFVEGLRGENVDFSGDRIGKEFFMRLHDPRFNPLEAIRGFKNPVFLIHGTGDIDVHPENSENYKGVLPEAELHLVEGAGHGYDSVKWQDELWEYSEEYIDRIMI